MNRLIVITNHPERVVINIIIVIIGRLGRVPQARKDTAVDITDMEGKTRVEEAPAAIGTIIKVVSVMKEMTVVAGIEVVIDITAVAIHHLLNLLLLVVGAEAADPHLPLRRDIGKEIPGGEIIAVTTKEGVEQPILTCIHTSKRERLSTQ
jgi:hypothetical protein